MKTVVYPSGEVLNGEDLIAFLSERIQVKCKRCGAMVKVADLPIQDESLCQYCAKAKLMENGIPCTARKGFIDYKNRSFKCADCGKHVKINAPGDVADPVFTEMTVVYPNYCDTCKLIDLIHLHYFCIGKYHGTDELIALDIELGKAFYTIIQNNRVLFSPL